MTNEQSRPEPSSSAFARLRAARPGPSPAPSVPASDGRSRFDPTSWSGALIVMTALCALLWMIQIVNAALDYRLDRYGLRPRDITGLEGIATSPLLHASYAHLIANSAPFVLIGWVVLLAGVRLFVLSSVLIIALGGLGTWLVAPSGVVVGASGLIMGWLGYLLARAYFSRRVAWIVIAVLVVFFFGGLLGGLLPSVNSDVSWQGHVAGFVAGVLAGWVLHPRRVSSRGRARARQGQPGSQPPGAQAQPLS